jgi:branched-chain amino acid transport system ATP-binding protein
MVSAVNNPVLTVSHLSAWWGPAQALFDVSLQVGAGELVVLQGLNGAGKSTLLQAIMDCGPSIHCSVSYTIDSEQLSQIASPLLDKTAQTTQLSQLAHTVQLQDGPRGLPSHRRAQLGLGYVPEDRRLFTALTVQENLHIACTASASVRAQRQEQVLALFPALGNMLQRQAFQMSGGEQQMLAIARTLMTGPRLLLLDEPCEGIAPVLVEQLANALLALRSQGMPMLVAEQNHILARHADRVLTLIAGRITAFTEAALSIT